MDYTIKRSDGKTYVTIPSNVILGPNVPKSSPTPVNLIGRDKISFGQPQNENFLWLAENFRNDTAPKGSIKGQIWYKQSSGIGQLLLSKVDNARNPIPNDLDTEGDWASIPVITVTNTLPNADESIMGRMALTNNGDSLRVVMRDKEWREIQTTRPVNKQFERLLDINYDPGKKYIQFDSNTPVKPIVFFNNGAAELPLPEGYSIYQDGDGVFRYGSNYFYNMKVMVRVVNELQDGTLVPVPETYKSWMIKGTFWVDNAGNFTFGTTTPNIMPDPRRIHTLDQITDTITEAFNTQQWGVNMVINGVDPSIPGGTDTSKDGYTNYVRASLDSNKHLGFKMDGQLPNLTAGAPVKTQWSVLLSITGIPPVGV